MQRPWQIGRTTIRSVVEPLSSQTARYSNGPVAGADDPVMHCRGNNEPVSSTRNGGKVVKLCEGDLGHMLRYLQPRLGVQFKVWERDFPIGRNTW